MFQLFVCIKSLKSFKIIELHPKEGTPLWEVNVIFLSGLMNLSVTKRREQNLSRWKCEPLKFRDFPTFKSCGLKSAGGCCVLSVFRCAGAQLEAPLLCVIYHLVYPPLSGLLAQSAFALNSLLWGFLATTVARIPGFLAGLHSRWESIPPPPQSWGVVLQFCRFLENLPVSLCWQFQLELLGGEFWTHFVTAPWSRYCSLSTHSSQPFRDELGLPRWCWHCPGCFPL